jgi:hypothetical protein
MLERQPIGLNALCRLCVWLREIRDVNAVYGRRPKADLIWNLYDEILAAGTNTAVTEDPLLKR